MIIIYYSIVFVFFEPKNIYVYIYIYIYIYSGISGDLKRLENIYKIHTKREKIFIKILLILIL